MNFKKSPSNKSSLIITPDTKIAEILEAYPETEDLLIKLVPSFGKLKNPVLRRTIGRLATVRQAAEVGKVSLSFLINHLREAVGQKTWNESGDQFTDASSEIPDWVKSGTIVKSIDARPILDRGDHPIQLVMIELNSLKQGNLLVLITPFIPSPLIEKAKDKGFKTWTREESENIFKTYFGK